MALKKKRLRSQTVPPLGDFLPYRLSLLAAHLSLTNADLRVYRPVLTLQEWKILSIVADSGPLTPVEIRRLGTQDKSTISWALKRLQRNALVVKHKAADSRTFEVAISPKGRTYYKNVSLKAAERAQLVLKALSQNEVKQLQRLVDKLSSAVPKSL